jgi:hypothetical protein
MTAEALNINWPVDTISDRLLSCASQTGIHMFQPEQSERSLTVIGNADQGLITLVFSVGGQMSHLSLYKWFWNIPLVRWIFALWLTA